MLSIKLDWVSPETCDYIILDQILLSRTIFMTQISVLYISIAFYDILVSSYLFFSSNFDFTCAVSC